MNRTFLIISQNDKNARIVSNIHSRESELLSYEYEKESHESIIANLGNISWNETNLAYKGLTRDVMIEKALLQGLNETEIQHIADLLSLDHHKLNLNAVKIEIAKSEKAYDFLLATLPVGAERDNAIRNYKEALLISKL